MATGTIFDDWITFSEEVLFNGASAPNPSNFYAILCNTSTWDRTSSMAAVIATELPAANGYTRQSYNPSTATYVTANQRAELPSVTVNWTITGSSVQWDAIAIVADATGTPGNTTGRLVAFYKPSSAQTIPAGGQLNAPLRKIGANVGFVSGV